MIYNAIQYKTINKVDCLMQAQSAIFTHISQQSHYMLLSRNLEHPFTDSAFNTSDIEYLQMTALHATKTGIIPLTCGVITRMSLIKQSDNADVLLQGSATCILWPMSRTYIMTTHHTVSTLKGIYAIIENIASCIISTSPISFALHCTKWVSHHLCIVITGHTVQWVLRMRLARCMLLSCGWGHCKLSQYNIISMMAVDK